MPRDAFPGASGIAVASGVDAVKLHGPAAAKTLVPGPMKILVGKFTVLTAVAMALTPLRVVAQNIASQPGLVNRSIDRVMLLPGPTLLSPARGAPQSTPNLTIVPASQVRTPGEWRFVPAYRPHGEHRLQAIPPNSNGTLKLGSDTPRSPSALEAVGTLRISDPLRFDTPLRSPASPLHLQALPPSAGRD